MTKITIRRFDRNVVQALTNRGFPEPLARALAARHVTSPSDLDYEFKEMLSPWDLKNCKEAGEAIADAIWKQKNIVITRKDFFIRNLLPPNGLTAAENIINEIKKQIQ